METERGRNIILKSRTFDDVCILLIKTAFDSYMIIRDFKSDAYTKLEERGKAPMIHGRASKDFKKMYELYMNLVAIFEKADKKKKEEVNEDERA